MKALKGISNLAVTAIASMVLILLGIIYFMVTVWMIKIGAQWAGFTNIEGNMVVLGACIVTAAAMIGSAIQK
jgi:hypothetical protein